MFIVAHYTEHSQFRLWFGLHQSDASYIICGQSQVSAEQILLQCEAIGTRRKETLCGVMTELGDNLDYRQHMETSWELAKYTDNPEHCIESITTHNKCPEACTRETDSLW